MGGCPQVRGDSESHRPSSFSSLHVFIHVQLGQDLDPLSPRQQRTKICSPNLPAALAVVMATVAKGLLRRRLLGCHRNSLDDTWHLLQGLRAVTEQKQKLASGAGVSGGLSFSDSQRVGPCQLTPIQNQR